ncbi:MAG: DUF2804 domain-containing protein [Deltaproteobacteria bacterium]|nr:DUF2804 domain-containing protein [Deltaproteobacteria bacterium]
MEPADNAPPKAKSGSGYAYGRYRQPIPLPDISAPGLMGAMRLKEWHYTSVVTGQWFFAFAVVNLGYAAKCFAYLVDRERPANAPEYSELSPMGRAVKFAPSSVSGETRWEAGRNRLVAGHGGDRWQIEVDLPLGPSRVTGSFNFAGGDALALLHRLANGQPAYTHKAAGIAASGSIQWNGQTISLDGGVATLDWTRSVALRETAWKWCSLAGFLPDGRRIGLNLSADVYDGPGGSSQENGLWIDGRLYLLGGVEFALPGDPRREPWIIRSRSGTEVELEFLPLGTREEHLNLGVIRSDFIQPYGTFRGRLAAAGDVAPVPVDGLFGVVEKHLSVW